MKCEISIRVRSGAIVSLGEHSAGNGIYKLDVEILSLFVHLRGELPPVLRVERTGVNRGFFDVKVELMDTMFLVYKESIWRLSLQEGIIGQPLQGHALCSPSSLMLTAEHPCFDRHAHLLSADAQRSRVLEASCQCESCFGVQGLKWAENGAGMLARRSPDHPDGLQ